MTDAYKESIAALDNLAEAISLRVSAPLSRSLATQLSRLANQASQRGLAPVKLHALRDRVLALPGAARDVDPLSGEALRPSALAVAGSLDRRLHLSVLDQIAVGERQPTDAIYAALTWLLANGGSDDLERVIQLPEGAIPRKLEPLRRLLLGQLQSAERGRAETPARASDLRLTVTEQPKRFLVGTADGAPLPVNERREMFTALDRWAEDGAITTLETRRQDVADFPIVWLCSSTVRRLKEIRPQVRVESDVPFFLQAPNRPTVRIHVGDAATKKPIAGAAVSLLLKGSLKPGTAWSGFRTGEYGWVEVPVVDGDIDEIRVDPPPGYWSRYLVWTGHGSRRVELRALPSPVGDPSWWHVLLGCDGSADGGRGVRIVLVDTGAAPHSDLKLAGGWCVSDVDGDWTNDDNGHGTHCAGILCGQSVAFRGIASEAELWVARAFGRGEDQTYASRLIAAVRSAVDAGADVINLSLGSRERSPLLEIAIQQAVERGVLVVAAGGNQGRHEVCYPARLPDVVGVSACGRRGTYPADSQHCLPESDLVEGDLFFASYSNFGEGIDLCAPGVAIVSTAPGDGYAALDGTSMAAPMVSGVAARVLASDTRIQALSGRGRVDALRARLAKMTQKVQTWERSHQGDGIVRLEGSATE